MTQPPYPPPGYQGPGQPYGPPAPSWQTPAQPGVGSQGPQQYWQARYGQVPQGQWPQYAPPPKKNTGRVVGIVVAVLAMPVVIAAIVGITAGVRGEPPITATSSEDFDAVCKNGSVSNAADYQKPYKIVAFYESVARGTWPRVSILSPEGGYSGYGLPPSSISVVACLSRQSATEKKEGTCEYDSAGDKDRVSRYSVDYEVELREAKTGKRIKSLGSVRGPSTSCPVVALYNGSNHKMYGYPDKDQLDAKLKEFAAG